MLLAGPTIALAFPFLVPVVAKDDATTLVDPPTVVEVAQEADAPTLTVDAAVARLQARYDAIDDFQADFTQETFTAALAETRTSSGEVYFLRPGRMVWDYGDTRRLVLDGESLHSVDFERGQYYSTPVASSDLPTAMRFLMGDGNLADDFAITMLDDSTASRAVLELVPREPSPDYERLAFAVDTATWNVVETTIVDALGNTNTIRFSGIRTNVGMDPGAFTFVPPAGLERMEIPD